VSRFRNYWYYSIGLVIAWAVVIRLALTIRGPVGVQPFLLTFGGFCIGWVSTTIAWGPRDCAGGTTRPGLVQDRTLAGSYVPSAFEGTLVSSSG
jgi:hypothetical protein